MKSRSIFIALAITGLLSGCDQAPLNNHQGESAAQATSTFVDSSAIVATVNGSPITENMVALYSEQRNARSGGKDPGNEEAALQELISLELASQDGVKNGLENKPEVALQINQQRRAVIASAAIQHQVSTNTISEDTLKALYDEKVGAGGSEYKARHILVETEEKARELIKELDGGADFSEMAKKHSTGPSGKEGGDLGWFSPKQMVAPFSEAASKLEKGNYTKDPVKTQFGWHIIMLEDVRGATPPPYEQVVQQLEGLARNQQLQAYLEKLKTDATIDIKKTAAAPATAPAPAASDSPAK